MPDKKIMSKTFERLGLGAVLLLFASLSIVGIGWGLPSRALDPYLFGDDPPWPGEKIHRLAGAAGRFAPGIGADVDVDPIDLSSERPVLVTATKEDVAKIYLRYRLYTHQPDEMITMMALAGMKPRSFELDPRLYQYGGLFIYPVGALIKCCGLVGLIEVRSDPVYYLDHPDEFGKFYIVARAYSAAWGLAGVLIVFLIGRRLGGAAAGLLAALLFSLMPVVVCMAHEGKPHLPGAVLMLAAVLLAMRYGACEPPGATSAELTRFHSVRRRDWWLMCMLCGAALGMVLSSLPIFVLIPLLAMVGARRESRRLAEEGARSGGDAGGSIGSAIKQSALGVMLASAVYLVTNPYVAINLLSNREVLRSNFGNSLAMYDVARVGEGLVRVLELTAEGTTLPILVLGVPALGVAALRRKAAVGPLVVCAAVFFLQFVLIGAGKPAEYGRFGVFTNAALAIGTACLLASRWGRLRSVVNWLSLTVVVSCVAFFGLRYVTNFRIDTTLDHWRTLTATGLTPAKYDPETGRSPIKIVVMKDPAPYGCPPLNFARTDVYRLRNLEQSRFIEDSSNAYLVSPVDRRRHTGSRKPAPLLPPLSVISTHLAGVPGSGDGPLWPFETPISWANKPFELRFLWMIRDSAD